MSDAMSSAEFSEQYVELLPARTVLSLLRSGTSGAAGADGEPGTHGAKGQSMTQFTFLGMIGWGGSDSSDNPSPETGSGHS